MGRQLFLVSGKQWTNFIPPARLRRSSLPQGVWLRCGGLKNVVAGRQRMHVYRVEVDRSRVVWIETLDELHAFHEAYAVETAPPSRRRLTGIARADFRNVGSVKGYVDAVLERWRRRPAPCVIDWARVRRDGNGGVVISPGLWKRHFERLSPGGPKRVRFRWYRDWSRNWGACGCVWGLRAMAGVEPVHEGADRKPVVTRA